MLGWERLSMPRAGGGFDPSVEARHHRPDRSPSMNDLSARPSDTEPASVVAEASRLVGVDAPTSLPAAVGSRPLVARRDRFATQRAAMTRVFRTRSLGLVSEFGAPA